MRPLVLAECDTGKEPISQQVSKQAAWRGGEGGGRNVSEREMKREKKRGLQGGDVRQRPAGHRLTFWLTTPPQQVPIKMTIHGVFKR